jgi:hypothetical protein
MPPSTEVPPNLADEIQGDLISIQLKKWIESMSNGKQASIAEVEYGSTQLTKITSIITMAHHFVCVLLDCMPQYTA